MSFRDAMVTAALCLGIAGIPGGTAALAATQGSPWRASYFPDVPLVTHDGKTVHFYTDLIKDKVVAISFIFTHCHGPCPAETANLRRVQKLLGSHVGKDVFMYSISIDPGNDSPRELKAYARKFGAGPGWTFLTGKEEDITLIRRKLGVYSGGGARENINDHNVSFVVGNEAKGQWIKRSPFDNPKVLAWLLGSSLQSLPVVRAGVQSYAEAPRLPSISRGEDLFRSRCSSCHSMGGDDGVGPGLAGVTRRRSGAWLAQWLKRPDLLLARKDPVATALLAKYSNVLMPNLGLDDAEVDALIRFLRSHR